MLIIALGVLAAILTAGRERIGCRRLLYAGALFMAPILLRRDAELGLLRYCFFSRWSGPQTLPAISRAAPSAGRSLRRG